MKNEMREDDKVNNKNTAAKEGAGRTETAHIQKNLTFTKYLYIWIQYDKITTK